MRGDIGSSIDRERERVRDRERERVTFSIEIMGKSSARGPPPIDLSGLVLVEQAEHHNDYHQDHNHTHQCSNSNICNNIS